MRAVYLDRFRQPSEIQVVESDLPKLNSGEILIRVRAAGVNPSDVKYAAGVVPTSLLPRIPGRDFAGVVEQGPPHLTGKEVYGTGGDIGITRDGSHAEYLAVSETAVSLKPEGISMAEAAAVGTPYITAYKAVAELAKLQASETLCVIGGSGAVGSAATAIAHWLGARVIGTSHSPGFASPSENSADCVVILPNEDLKEAVNAYTDGKGAQVVFNTVGGETFEPGVLSLAKGGRMVCISAIGDHRVSFDLMTFYKRSMSWFGLDTMDLTAVECAPILDRLRPGFDTGTFKVTIGREFPLEQASEAYQLVQKGGAGKVVLVMD